MRVKVDEINRIDKMIEDRNSRSADVKLLSLKLISELDDIERVSEIVKIPESTLYEWLREWNEKKRDK